MMMMMTTMMTTTTRVETERKGENGWEKIETDDN